MNSALESKPLLHPTARQLESLKRVCQAQKRMERKKFANWWNTRLLMGVVPPIFERINDFLGHPACGVVHVVNVPHDNLGVTMP